MTLPDMTDEDYATPQRLAMYLEAGWSDFLFEAGQIAQKTNDVGYPNPLHDHVTPDFFCGVAALAHTWATGLSLRVSSACDVGGGTGRAIFELDKQFPDIQQLVLIEPSRCFCDWAKLLLASEELLPEFPIVSCAKGPRWITPSRRPPPIRRADERLRVFNGTLEDFVETETFSLVTCLNVVDRHPRPEGLVSGIARIMNGDGLLVVSSPLDFRPDSTPEVGCWIEDLNALFEGHDSWEHVGEGELSYEFRLFNRSWTRLTTQVVGKRWRPE